MMRESPPPDPGTPSDHGMSKVVRRNIEALAEIRRREERRRTGSDQVADGVTRFAGSMWCVYFHGVCFGGWLLVNNGLVLGVEPFDPFPFVMLAMIASVKAIFLSTFILISQNRMKRAEDRRAELDLQINLLTEHELTRAMWLLDEIAQRLDVPRPPDGDLHEVKKDIHPEKVAKEIQDTEQAKRSKQPT